VGGGGEHAFEQGGVGVFVEGGEVLRKEVPEEGEGGAVAEGNKEFIQGAALGEEEGGRGGMLLLLLLLLLDAIAAAAVGAAVGAAVTAGDG